MLERYLSPGDGVLDLGANVGKYTTIYANAIGPTGRIIAVEPHHDTIARLSTRCKGFSQVTCIQAAIGGNTLYVDVGDCQRNSLFSANRMQLGPSLEVPTETLDHLASLVPHLKAIKMDVQGAECHVLDTGPETLARDLVWAVELWPEGLRNAGRSVEELAAQFMAYDIHPQKRPGNEAPLATWTGLLKHMRGWAGHRSLDVILSKQPSPEMA